MAENLTNEEALKEIEKYSKDQLIVILLLQKKALKKLDREINKPTLKSDLEFNRGLMLGNFEARLKAEKHDYISFAEQLEAQEEFHSDRCRELQETISQMQKMNTDGYNMKGE